MWYVWFLTIVNGYMWFHFISLLDTEGSSNFSHTLNWCYKTYVTFLSWLEGEDVRKSCQRRISPDRYRYSYRSVLHFLVSLFHQVVAPPKSA